MKKYVIILFIIVAIIVCTLLIKTFLLKEYNPTIGGQITVKNALDTGLINSSIINKNLRLSLHRLYTGEISDKHLSTLLLDESTVDNIKKFSRDYNLLIEFSTMDESLLTMPVFDYIVYDKSGNIINTSIVYTQGETKTNNFIKCFMEKEYNSDNVLEFMNYSLNTTWSPPLQVNSNDNSKLLLLAISISDSDLAKIDTSEIHVLIINPSYRTYNGKKINFDDTFFEFILEE